MAPKNAEASHRLSDVKIKNANPREKTYKLADGGGLYLKVTSVGSGLWRMSYTQSNGKKNHVSFGSYPVVTLAAAREKRLKAKQLIDAGTDPGQARRTPKQERNTAEANTFEVIPREKHANKADSSKESAPKNVLQRLANDIFLRLASTLSPRSKPR